MNTQRKKIPFLPGWILAAVLFLLGIFVYYCVLGCSFSGQLLWCFGALVLVYQCINLLSLKNEKAAKMLRRILTVCVCIGFLVAAVTGCFITHAAFGDTKTDCDYIVVLGAGVNGTVPSLSLRERINAAYDYLTAHPDSVAIVSGGKGSGEDITEALCMYNELTKMGIDGSRVWMEDKATSTFENLQFSMAKKKPGSGPIPLESYPVSITCSVPVFLRLPRMWIPLASPPLPPGPIFASITLSVKSLPFGITLFLEVDHHDRNEIC